MFCICSLIVFALLTIEFIVILHVRLIRVLLKINQSINQSHGRQPRGRPRKRWLDNIAEDCEDLNLFKRRVLQTTEWNGEILSATRAAGGSERGDIVFVAESLSQKSESSSAVAQLPFVALLLYCDGGQGIVGLIQ